MVALLTTLSFLTSTAYSVVGSFFPIEVYKCFGIIATGVLVFVSSLYS